MKKQADTVIRLKPKEIDFINDIETKNPKNFRKKYRNPEESYTVSTLAETKQNYINLVQTYPFYDHLGNFNHGDNKLEITDKNGKITDETWINKKDIKEKTIFYYHTGNPGAIAKSVQLTE